MGRHQSNPKLDRTATGGLDRYYTPVDLAARCLAELEPFLPPDATLIEPAAGTGTWMQAAPAARWLAFDVDPAGPHIVEADWFGVSQLPPRSVVVGNPPYGTNGARLAVDFFNHAAKLGAHAIAFLLPPLFRKWTQHRKLDRSYWLCLDKDVPGVVYDTPGAKIKHRRVFQIWAWGLKGRTHRFGRKVPGLVSFGAGPDDCNHVLRSIGNVRWLPVGQYKQSVMYIRLSRPVGPVKLFQVQSLLNSWSKNCSVVPFVNREEVQEAFYQVLCRV